MTEKQEPCRVFLKNFGCSTNVADGEFMAGQLLNAGFEIAEKVEEADVLVYNTCAVKTPTENRTIEILKKAGNRQGKRLIVTGCLPLINLKRLETQVDFDGVLGPSCGSHIVEAVDKVLVNERVVWLDEKSGAKPCLDLPRRALNPVVGIIPVAFGCSGSCTYCCVVHARGRLRSCSIGEIVNRVRRDLNSGAKEIWLTGQDTGCYGRDIEVDLVDLLNEVCGIDGEFWVRVGMMTPNFASSMLSDLVEVFRNEHIFRFLHLPVQSGDDEVLKRMNRGYSVDDFRRVVDAFRRSVPSITLSTDVICGFPGESTEAFEHSLQLIDQIRPDVVNISKFFPRPKTLAERMTHKIPSKEVTARSNRMSVLAKRVSSERNRAWSDWKGRVLLDEIGKRPQSLIGRNLAYKPIVIKTEDKSLFGNFVNAHVTKTFQTYLEAEVTDDLF